jgi:membrane protease YdiL (CAAX protease family)
VEFQSPSERLWEWIRNRELRPSKRPFRHFRLEHKAHWLILTALIALLASNSLATWSPKSTDQQGPRLSFKDLFSPARPNPETVWSQLANAAEFFSHSVTSLASIVAIYFAFSSIPQLFPRFIWWVGIPIVLGRLLPMALSTIAGNIRDESVLSSTHLPPLSEFVLPGSVGPGPILAATALAILGIAFWHADKGQIPIPIRFASHHAVTEGSNLLRFFVLTMVLGIVATHFLNGAAGALRLLSPDLFQSRIFDSDEIPLGLIVLQEVPVVVHTLPVVLAALILWGKGWSAQLRAVLCRAPWPDYAFAIAAPIAIYFVAQGLTYGTVRVLLRLDDLNSIPPPAFRQVFALPPWSSVILILPAFLEEIGWRGYFQTSALRRYGIQRGLLLAGLAWAVWHIPADVTASLTLAQSTWVAGGRLIGTMLSGALFGWLFLRSGSVFPVTLLHAVHNSFLLTASAKSPSPLVESVAHLLPTIVLVWVLFRVYPPVEPEPSNQTPIKKPEGAEA